MHSSWCSILLVYVGGPSLPGMRSNGFISHSSGTLPPGLPAPPSNAGVGSAADIEARVAAELRASRDEALLTGLRQQV